MVGQLRIELDRDRCISAGRCAATAPDVFDQDEEGVVVLIAADLPADSAQLLHRAEYLCPAAVITVVGDPVRPGADPT